MTKVCRFCLEIIENLDYISLDETKEQENILNSIKKMLAKCIPELQLISTTDPIMCSLCYVTLCSAYLCGASTQFRQKLEDTEKRIAQYRTQTSLPIGNAQLALIAENDTEKRKTEGECADVIELSDDECEVDVKSEVVVCVSDDEVAVASASTSDVVNEVQSFRCHLCGKNFGSKTELEMHLHGNCGAMHFCRSCTRSFADKKSLNSHMLDHKNAGDLNSSVYHCDLCDNFYVLFGDLRRHKLSHGPQPYKCVLCEKISNNSYKLRTHILRCHTKLRPYKCEVCDMSFLKNWECFKHMLSVHYKYKCKACDEKFGRLSNLRQHISKKHGRIKPYECETCAEIFHHEFSKLNHARKHEALDWDEDLCECPVCNKLIFHKNGLEKHLPTHLVCNVCKTACASVEDLRKHVKTHPIGGNILCHDCTKGRTQTVDEDDEEPKLVIDESINTFSSPDGNETSESSADSADYVKKRNQKIHASVVNNSSNYKSRKVEKKMKKVPTEGEKGGKFWCMDCNLHLKTFGTFRRHIRKDHKGVFMCPICKRKFLKFRSFRKHVVTHDNDASSLCRGCGKRVVLTGYLGSV